MKTNIKTLLDTYYQEFSQPKYWQVDPIIVPAIFSDPLDIEIAGFLVLLLLGETRKYCESRQKSYAIDELSTL